MSARIRVEARRRWVDGSRVWFVRCPRGLPGGTVKDTWEEAMGVAAAHVQAGCLREASCDSLS